MKNSFQDIMFALNQFWSNQGCLMLFAYDTEKGAGTMSPHTFLNALGPKPVSVAYIEPSRRPTDGRYAQNRNRLSTPLNLIFKSVKYASLKGPFLGVEAGYFKLKQDECIQLDCLYVFNNAHNTPETIAAGLVD